MKSSFFSCFSFPSPSGSTFHHQLAALPPNKGPLLSWPALRHATFGFVSGGIVMRGDGENIKFYEISTVSARLYQKVSVFFFSIPAPPPPPPPPPPVPPLFLFLFFILSSILPHRTLDKCYFKLMPFNVRLKAS